MNFKFSKRLFIIILAIIFLVFSLFCIRDTFARYITSLTTQSHIDLGKWLIKVNDKNVMENSTLTEVIKPVFNNSSEYIADNKIVPTSSGYIEIKLDYSNVNVPFQYDLTIVGDNNNFLEDIKFTDCLVDDKSSDFDGSEFSNTITPDGNTTVQTLKLNFSWVDGDGETMDDVADTKASHDFENTTLNLAISFTQLNTADL